MRDKNRNRKTKKWIYLIGFMALICFCKTSVYATEENTKVENSKNRNTDLNPLVILDSYTLDNSDVVYGENNMLHIKFKNVSQIEDATNILVSYTSENQIVVPVYGEANLIYIDKIPAGETDTVDLPICVLASTTGYVQMNFSMQYTANNTIRNSVTNMITFMVRVGNSFRQDSLLELNEPEEVIVETDSKIETGTQVIYQQDSQEEMGVDTTTILVGVMVTVVLLSLFGLVFGRSKK